MIAKPEIDKSCSDFHLPPTASLILDKWSMIASISSVYFAVLQAMKENSDKVPSLLTDYILKGKLLVLGCPVVLTCIMGSLLFCRFDQRLCSLWRGPGVCIWTTKQLLLMNEWINSSEYLNALVFQLTARRSPFILFLHSFLVIFHSLLFQSLL